MIKYEFSERLIELRRDKKLSQKNLGEKIGVSNAAINRWENAINDIKGEEIIKLAKFFNVSADYLLGISED